MCRQLLEAPFLRVAAANDRTRLAIRLAYLLLQAMAISIPIGLACAVFGLLQGGIGAHWSTRAQTIAMTMMCGIYVGYYLVTPDIVRLPPIAFEWTPNLLAVLAAITLQALPTQSALSPEP